MSQKTAKRIRRLEARMDTQERRVDAWDAAVTAVHKQELLDTTAQRDTERHRAKQAERAATMWRWMTCAALVSAFVILAIAVMAVRAKAVPVGAIDPQMGVTAENAAETSLEDPPMEETENELIEAALLDKAHVIENCTVTHYDICVECCGKADGITASGVRATPGVTVAVDTSVIPLGSDVLVDYGDGEIHYYRADDAGAAVKGNRIDLCVAGHDEALQLGRRTATVYWVAQEEVTGNA